jgi:hypothetical protein
LKIKYYCVGTRYLFLLLLNSVVNVTVMESTWPFPQNHMTLIITRARVPLARIVNYMVGEKRARCILTNLNLFAPLIAKLSHNLPVKGLESLPAVIIEGY